jgi:hypothetical protein
MLLDPDERGGDSTVEVLNVVNWMTEAESKCSHVYYIIIDLYLCLVTEGKFALLTAFG